MSVAASMAAPNSTTAVIRAATTSTPRPNTAAGRNIALVPPGAIILVASALVSFGVVMIASATVSLDRPLLGSHFWRTPAGRQVIFAVVGGLVTLVTMKLSVRALASNTARKWAAPLLFGLSILLLIAAFIPGFADPHRGSNRWLRLAPIGLDFGVQPSEVAKLGLVALLAWLLAERATDARSFFRGFIPAALATGLCIALVGKENLGTAALLAAVTCCMLAAGGCHFLHLTLMASAGFTGLTALLFAAPYRMERITAFRDIWADPQGKGYQPIQSLTSIATGGWMGVGLGSGLQKFGYLPESHTDFIFAIVCEETGLVGGGLVIGLFCAFAWLGIRIMLSAPTPFERLLAFGLTMVICLQAAINIAVVTVTMPTTGVPLPMISAGGSGLLTVSVSVGLLAGIAERARRSHANRAAEAGA